MMKPNCFARTMWCLCFGLCVFACVVAPSSCNPEVRHFIGEEQVRVQTERDFAAKRAFLAESLPLFSDTSCSVHELFYNACCMETENVSFSQEEIEALVFLYAYMPLNDICMQPPRFYLEQIRASFSARDKFSWGHEVPELLFRHFVLPPRINDEDIDSCRTVFLQELTPRLEGLSMREAALEVNHWCHEKVTYAPTDSRTSGPLATLARAYGRCGEESVFTTAALRAVGIPARQVYTPRWAHTDDNHAWVEVWVDGAWHYMGACEPEPVLDRAWFSESVQRAMLVHTWVFGRYAGPEEVLGAHTCYTEINVLPAYAPSKQCVVKVLDVLGEPVEGAVVSFDLYNYAEFYPLVRRTTNRHGETSLTTGMGSLLVQATKEGFRAIAHYPAEKRDTLYLSLKPFDGEGVEHYRLVPPPELAFTKSSAANTASHAARLAREDSIRMAYMATFPYSDQARAKELIRELKLDASIALPLLQNSLSNGTELAAFLRTTAPEQRKRALKLLSLLPVKDLQEVPARILRDHLEGVSNLGAKYKDHPVYEQYVLQPRIDNEIITAYREVLWKAFGSMERDDADILNLVRAYLFDIEGVQGHNLRDFIKPPVATFETRKAGARSRMVFGVALLRTLGVPARIDPVHGRSEAYIKGIWEPVEPLAESEEHTGKRAKLQILYTPQDGLNIPKYETHYTLGRWEGDRFHTLGLGNGEGDLHSSGGREVSRDAMIEVLPGDYRLITGRRLADGTVLSRLEYFRLTPGVHYKLELVFEKAEQEVAVIGAMNPEARYMPEAREAPTSILQTAGRGFFVLLLMDATKEPSRHLTGDLMAHAKALEATKLPVVCLFKDHTSLQTFQKSAYHGLPSMYYGYDTDGSFVKELAELTEQPDLPEKLPVAMLADSFGRVFYLSTGYNIGTGEALLSACNQVMER